MGSGNLLSAGGLIQHGFSPSPFSFQDLLLRCETVARLCLVVTATFSYWETGVTVISTFTYMSASELC